MPALVQIMEWRRPGDIIWPMMVGLQTRICISRPEWINVLVMCRGFTSTNVDIHHKHPHTAMKYSFNTMLFASNNVHNNGDPANIYIYIYITNITCLRCISSVIDFNGKYLYWCRPPRSMVPLFHCFKSIDGTDVSLDLWNKSHQTQHLNVSRLGLPSPLPNPLKPGVKSRMKM